MSKRVVSASLTPDIYEKFEAFCEKDHRTISQMIRKLIIETLKKDGK